MIFSWWGRAARIETLLLKSYNLQVSIYNRWDVRINNLITEVKKMSEEMDALNSKVAELDSKVTILGGALGDLKTDTERILADLKLARDAQNDVQGVKDATVAVQAVLDKTNAALEAAAGIKAEEDTADPATTTPGV